MARLLKTNLLCVFRPCRYLWMTLTTQAGVTLGLANGIRRTHRDRWGPTVADAIVAAVILNQFVGPFLFKYAARKVCLRARERKTKVLG